MDILPRLIVFLRHVIRAGAVEIGLRESGIYFKGFGVVGDGLGEVALFVIGNAARGLRVRISGVYLDRPGKVGDGLG
jgi:hypothetical protein